MITDDQLREYVKTHKINETVLLREYFQLVFLSVFYSCKGSEQVFFKGGTAVHLLFGAKRFSEDLDFTVMMNEREFTRWIPTVFAAVQLQEQVTFTEKKTITGKRYLLTASPFIVPHTTFIRLDFSFRERVLKPEKATVKTDFPIVFTSYVYHLAKEEIFAEKIRALFTRTKGRDIYDLWYLATQGVMVDPHLIKEKLAYYGLDEKGKEEIIQRIDAFPKREFILDIRPFISLSEREKLPQFFDYLKDFLRTHLSA